MPRDLVQEQSYLTREFGSMVGKTIREIRPLTESEVMNMFGEELGGDVPFIVKFTDGDGFIPMADPEGNGFGFLEMTKTIKVA